jgi:hypothetical protein
MVSRDCEGGLRSDRGGGDEDSRGNWLTGRAAVGSELEGYSDAA